MIREVTPKGITTGGTGVAQASRTGDKPGLLSPLLHESTAWAQLNPLRSEVSLLLIVKSQELVRDLTNGRFRMSLDDMGAVNPVITLILLPPTSETGDEVLTQPVNKVKGIEVDRAESNRILTFLLEGGVEHGNDTVVNAVHAGV